MKHIRKYNESTQEFTFIDIVNILQDIIDDVELVDFLDEMKTVVGRFEDEGFYVHMMEPMFNNDSDKYDCHGVKWWVKTPGKFLN